MSFKNLDQAGSSSIAFRSGTLISTLSTRLRNRSSMSLSRIEVLGKSESPDILCVLTNGEFQKSQSSSSSPMNFRENEINCSDTPMAYQDKQRHHSWLDSDRLCIRRQIFESTCRKTDFIRANQDLSHERDTLRLRNRELESNFSEMKRELEVSRERLSELEGETKKMEKKKMELSRSMEFLEVENRDIKVLLRAALSEKQSAQNNQLKETNEQKRSVLLQIAERGLQSIGFGLGFRGSVVESSEMENLAKKEEDDNSMVIAIEKTIKNLRNEISQLKLSLDESRFEEERLKKITEEQARKLEENAMCIDKMQSQERFLTQNVEELVKVIREAESEISRWREACELEVEAGQREVTERDQLIADFKAEVEKTRSALAISEGKLKLKEELAKAAMKAEEAAEKSLRLAERRISELLRRIEHLYRQLEEAESTERRRGKFRYIWCWPLWRFPNASYASVTAAGSSEYTTNRAMLRYGG